MDSSRRVRFWVPSGRGVRQRTRRSIVRTTSCFFVERRGKTLVVILSTASSQRAPFGRPQNMYDGRLLL
jgi:hypothetical protein